MVTTSDSVPTSAVMNINLDVFQGRKPSSRIHVAAGISFCLLAFIACILVGQRLTNTSWPLQQAHLDLSLPPVLPTSRASSCAPSAGSASFRAVSDPTGRVVSRRVERRRPVGSFCLSGSTMSSRSR